TPVDDPVEVTFQYLVAFFYAHRDIEGERRGRVALERDELERRVQFLFVVTSQRTPRHRDVDAALEEIFDQPVRARLGVALHAEEQRVGGDDVFKDVAPGQHFLRRCVGINADAQAL